MVYPNTVAYDSKGNITSRKLYSGESLLSTDSFTWVDGKLIGQTDNTNTLRFIYNDNEEIVGFIRNDTEIYLYLKNLLGDVIGIVDETGSVVVTYEYDVWGKLLSASGNQTIGTLNPIRYRGYYYDTESGYYYLESRYYDPELRRFINADKLESLYSPKDTYLYADSVNVFAYCTNSPVQMVDYSGEKELTNKIEIFAYSLVFLFELDEYKNAFVITTKKQKKGKIDIKLLKEVSDIALSKMVFSYYEMIGNNVFTVMGGYATEKFYQEYYTIHNNTHKKDRTSQRPFLFSDSCVTYEIKQHILGYWYTQNLIGFTKLPKFMFVGSNFNEVTLEDKCRNIDILEQDVTDTFNRIYFSYYKGIRQCYKYTKADPFWVSGKKRKSNTVRTDWINKKIPTDML